MNQSFKKCSKFCKVRFLISTAIRGLLSLNLKVADKGPKKNANIFNGCFSASGAADREPESEGA